jgi:hypothetical protein
MIYQFLSVLVLCIAVAFGQQSDVANNSSSKLGICSYSATCSAGGYDGVCVSIGGGCCSGGTVTSGLCPGRSDFVCCL